MSESKWSLARICRVTTLAICLLAVPILVTAGEESFPCADENHLCTLPSTYDYYATSYGSDDRAIVFSTKNVNVIPCSNDLGEPSGPVVKRCRAVEIHPKPQENFVKCADEGGVCPVTVSAGAYRLARFGTPQGDHWLYNNVASNFDCRIGGFGLHIEPAGGVKKVCQLSTASIPPFQSGSPKARWQTCAAEHQDCKPETGAGTYLIRYGAGEGWAYRTLVGNGLICANDTFGIDPAGGSVKSCQYFQIPTVLSVTGQWVKITQCSGCASGEYKSSWGVEKGNTRENTSHWAQEVKLSVEAGIEIEGFSAKTTLESTTSFGGSKSVVDSFTETAGTELAYTCLKGAFWQFQTTVDEFCRPNSSSCSTTAKTKFYKCTEPGEKPNVTWMQ